MYFDLKIVKSPLRLVTPVATFLTWCLIAGRQKGKGGSSASATLHPFFYWCILIAFFLYQPLAGIGPHEKVEKFRPEIFHASKK